MLPSVCTTPAFPRRSQCHRVAPALAPGGCGDSPDPASGSRLRRACGQWSNKTRCGASGGLRVRLSLVVAIAQISNRGSRVGTLNGNLVGKRPIDLLPRTTGFARRLRRQEAFVHAQQRRQAHHERLRRQTHGLRQCARASPWIHDFLHARLDVHRFNLVVDEDGHARLARLS